MNGTSKYKEQITKSEKPLRFGVLGAAAINFSALFEAVESHPDAVIHAIAARTLKKAEEQIEKYKLKTVRAYGSYDELLRDPDVDAVYMYDTLQLLFQSSTVCDSVARPRTLIPCTTDLSPMASTPNGHSSPSALGKMSSSKNQSPLMHMRHSPFKRLQRSPTKLPLKPFIGASILRHTLSARLSTAENMEG